MKSRQNTVLIRTKQRVEVVDLFPHDPALVGVADSLPAALYLDRLRDGLDILIPGERRLDVRHLAVREEAQTTGVRDERIAGDARLLVVGFGEAAVDDNCPAARLDRALPLLHRSSDLTIS